MAWPLGAACLSGRVGILALNHVPFNARNPLPAGNTVNNLVLPPQVMKNQHLLLVTLLLCNACATEVGALLAWQQGAPHTGHGEAQDSAAGKYHLFSSQQASRFICQLAYRQNSHSSRQVSSHSAQPFRGLSSTLITVDVHVPLPIPLSPTGPAAIHRPPRGPHHRGADLRDHGARLR